MGNQNVLLKENNISDLFLYKHMVPRIFLYLLASNCSTERLFSTLIKIKNYLRSQLTEDHLKIFAILGIENKIFRKIEYEDITVEFACKKYFKIPL